MQGKASVYDIRTRGQRQRETERTTRKIRNHTTSQGFQVQFTNVQTANPQMLIPSFRARIDVAPQRFRTPSNVLLDSFSPFTDISSSTYPTSNPFNPSAIPRSLSTPSLQRPLHAYHSNLIPLFLATSSTRPISSSSNLARSSLIRSSLSGANLTK